MCLETFEPEIDNISYRTYQRRLESFNNWNGNVKPSLLASSGFYYTSKDDTCKCFYCGVEIFRWKYDDCPITEHYNYYKHCDLLECLNKSLIMKKSNQLEDCESTKKLLVYLLIVFIIVEILKHFISTIFM
jgi:hypothetical protein